GNPRRASAGPARAISPARPVPRRSACWPATVIRRCGIAGGGRVPAGSRATRAWPATWKWWSRRGLRRSPARRIAPCAACGRCVRPPPNRSTKPTSACPSSSSAYDIHPRSARNRSMPSSAANHPIDPRASMRWLLPVLIAYALLALLGGVLHRPLLSLIAAALLLLALAVPVLRRPSVAGVVLWLVLAALLLVPAALGRVQLALAGLPIAILGVLAWLFARSLGREPLVVRCIRLIEGEQRLALPGVARYARGVTAYWAIV